MSKAYNRVNWNFLKAVLLFMNFGTTWVNWIMECISTVQYSLLVNGSPSKPFHLSRGLRQGDPISLYLFLFYANILSLALTREENQKNLKGVKIGRNGLSFTHILFADDSFIFFQNDNRSFIALKKKTILRYCSLSRKSTNFNKSELFCSPNIDPGIQDSLASSLQVKLVQDPSKYLGINFKLRGNRISNFQDIIDRVKTSGLEGKSAVLSWQMYLDLLCSSLHASIFLCLF